MAKRGVTFVLFGGTGDLARRKLAPAFAGLVHSGVLNRKSTIIGISRKDWSDSEYREFLISGVNDKKEKKCLRKVDIRFYSADVTRERSLRGLAELLKKIEGKRGRDRIFYLSTSFKFFSHIVKELKRERLQKQRGKFVRIMFEKPFGFDMASSNKLDKDVRKAFSEKEIYRVDHYLGKESVQNIQALKFTNPIFNKMLSNKFVKRIDIIADESIGVANRIEYYNDAGAIRDMMQSHLLQVLSLVLMGKPSSKNPERIRDEKVKVLKRVEVLPAEKHLIGQYRSYSREAKKYGIKQSNIETFARIGLRCNNKRWSGVSINLRSGKKVGKKHGEVVIEFKNGDKAVIYIFPVQKVELVLKKKKKSSNLIDEKKFGFCPKCVFIPNVTNDYALLIKDAIRGDRTLFARADEIKEAWRIIDKVERIKKRIRFVKYKDGSNPEKKL